MEGLTGARLEDYVQNSDTCQFYKNQTLFVTGVTGFCGKVKPIGSSIGETIASNGSFGDALII